MSGENSVKVAVRIRPLVESEKNRGCQSIVHKLPAEQVVVNSDAKTPQMFRYNYVFASDDTQEMVYENSVQSMIRELFSGYNVTIFAYGQTGSGKTHTMGTTYDGNQNEDMGVIPRAIDHIFEIITSMPDHDVTVMCSFVELYQEKLYDLLSQNSREQSVVDIREMNNKIVMPNLTERPAKSTIEAVNCLMQGSADRAVGATAMNAHSSRSHAIFTITVQSTPKDNPAAAKIAHFRLVDLAGSERLKKTQAEGEQRKEGVAINKGLLALGDVIKALGSDKKDKGHINYRDSKLTRLLQDSLGGNSKTLMIACVSPADYNCDETVGTLRYANRAKNIKNRPVVNEDPKSAEINQQELREVQSDRVLAEHKTTIDNLENTVKNLQKEVSNTNKELEQRINEVTSAANKVNLLELNLNEQIAETKRAEESAKDIENTLNETVLAREQLSARIKTLEADLSAARTNADHISDEKAGVEATFLKEVQILEEKNKAITKEKEGAMAKYNELEAKFNSLNETFRDTEDEQADLVNRNLEYQKQLAELQETVKEIDVLNAKIQQNEIDLGNAMAQIQALQKNSEEKATEYAASDASKSKNIQSLESQLRETVENFEKYKTDAEQAKIKIENLIKSTVNESNEKDKRISQLEEKVLQLAPSVNLSDDLKNELKDKSEELKLKESNISELIKTVEELNKQCIEKDSHLEKVLREKELELRNDKKEREKENDKKERELKDMKRKCDQLQMQVKQDAANAKTSYNELQTQMDELKKKNLSMIDDKNKSILEQSDIKKKYYNEVKALKNEIYALKVSFREEKERLQNEQQGGAIELDRVLAEHISTIDDLENTVENLQKEVSNTNKELEQRMNEVTSAANKVNLLELNLNEQIAETKRAEENAKDIENTLNGKIKVCDQLSARVETLEAEANKLKDDTRRHLERMNTDADRFKRYFKLVCDPCNEKIVESDRQHPF